MMGTRLGGGEGYFYIRDHLPPSNASDRRTGLCAWALGQAVADKVYKPSWVEAGHWSKQILHRGALRVVCSAARQAPSNSLTLGLDSISTTAPFIWDVSQSDIWRIHPGITGIAATAEGLPMSIGGSMLNVIHPARNKRSS